MNLKKFLTFTSPFLQLRQESALPLAFFRIGLGLLLFYQAIILQPVLYALVGKLGIVQPEITAMMVPEYLPRLVWWTDFMEHAFGLAEDSSLSIFFWIYLLAIFFFTLGFKTRVITPIVWVLHLAMKTSSVSSNYGVTEFTNLILFYSIFSPIGQCLSLDAYGKSWPNTSLAAGLSRRVLRCHLIIVYVSSGIHKAQGQQWHNGEAVWRAGFTGDHVRLLWLADFPWLAVALCWAVLTIEIGYFLIWIPRLRAWWFWAIVGMHLSIAIYIGLWMFSLTMILFNIAAWWKPSLLPIAKIRRITSKFKLMQEYKLAKKCDRCNEN